MAKINLLIGEDAVNAFEEGGAVECYTKGFNNVEAIEYDEQTSPEDLVRMTLSAVNGSLDAIVISEADAKIIAGE